MRSRLLNVKLLFSTLLIVAISSIAMLFQSACESEVKGPLTTQERKWLGIHGFLMKPVVQSELAQMIRKLLNSRDV